MCDEPGSFAQRTLAERVPAILPRTSDTGHFEPPARARLVALRDELVRGGRPSLSGAPTSNQQLALFQPAAESHPVVDKLRALDLDRLTPIDALNLLAALKRETDT